MSLGLIGRKLGMTRVFTEDGASLPVTVVQVGHNRVVQVKRSDRDGYDAVQLTAGARKPSRVGKPAAGHFAKAAVQPGRGLWEFRVGRERLDGMAAGDELGVDLFSEGQLVDVTARSKGKGFQGVVKRHNFRMQDATHGNSRAHRAPGSIGQNQTPGRVFKNKKMAGHMGDARKTVQNLKVVRVDSERGLLLIHGAVPGAPSADVMVRPAVKAKG
ncbi:LSU ribosomal protein L3p (L3e) [Thioalkalivibrio nitratireducens DSM 14787]|uniref:Large ribosomal subunit protein uL3 n=1 Tax=Thioalkalivibrio nitratireducens (strain DSM 14787 / UNIQEM 213 / ALEN2) TaxID=1255043 RepID=L0DZ23_THIND|nr:50S ribosomal protein L3 [Thioalkalivibrio nitratireducens]AGA34215.1 LSU ribosomal protein L3p (L3e) [Thioalkalivibrio nitratireducens DSM 14787]